MAPALAKAPWKCETVRRFAYAFRDMDDLRDTFCKSRAEPMATVFFEDLGAVAEMLAA